MDVAWYRFDLSLLFPITGSHIKRIGLARVVVGAGSMYLTVPIFISLHLGVLAWGTHGIIAPLLGLAKTPAKNYLVIDRHKIKGLPLVDKLNCVFCGYANGLCELWNVRLDQLGQLDVEVSAPKKAAIGTLAALALPASLVAQFVGVGLIYDNLIAKPIGLRTRSRSEVGALLDGRDYAARCGRLARALLRHQKNLGIRLGSLLEQIESAFCPLKHLERRAEVVFPDHHDRFLDPDQLDEMRKILCTEGSVSEFKPTVRPWRERKAAAAKP